MLGLPLTPAAPLAEHVKRVQRARMAVRSRPSNPDQTNVLSEIGEDMRDYAADFQQHQNCKRYLLPGYTIRIANLSKICSLQPLVHSDYRSSAANLKELIEQAEPGKMASLAKITLPIEPPVELPMDFNRERQAWTLASEDPNVRIIGNFSTRIEVAPGVFEMGYGFCVARVPSFVQVVLYRGRYFLKDGYHRSIALLKRRITHVPVVFNEVTELEVEGRFSDEVVLGSHPPMLTDYLSDDVAAAGLHLASRNNIMIQATKGQALGYSTDHREHS